MNKRGWLVIALTCAILAGSSLIWYGTRGSSAGALPTVSHSPDASVSPEKSDKPEQSPSPAPSAVSSSYATKGSGTFDYAATGGDRVGTEGHLVHYTVATERGIGVDPETFAAAVQHTLADPRSWIAGGQYSFQRVPAGAASELTVHLATPATTDAMCNKRGVHTRGEVSCRGGRDVIINLKRWQIGVPWYPTVAEYRNMVVNHEVGHFLGHGHAVCPRKGAPAPVMARQTFGLEGCAVNAWPYPDGKTFVTGPPAPR